MEDSTRLRYISSTTALGLSEAVSSLPFKVEMKEVVFAKGRFFAWFVIPDNVVTFINQDV